VRRLIAVTSSGLFLFLKPSFGLEYPFISVDILGSDFTSGSTTYHPSADTYTVTADGHDIWDTEDDFRFLYVEMSGNFSLSVRVDNPAGLWPHSWSKAGIMVRQDLSPGSKDVYLVATRDKGVAFQWRDNPNLPASWTGTSEPAHPLSYPVWLRIVRNGDTFTGWFSTDGRSWANPSQNSHALPMTDPVLVGICLTSHLSGVLATATFGDFHIPKLETSTVAIPPPDQTCREGETVLLDGKRSWNATSFRWEQIVIGDEPSVVVKNPSQPVAKFIAPQLDIASILTFRLTVYGPAGNDSALTRVVVKANNAPMVAPANLRSELGNLSVRLSWDGIFDADYYLLKRAEQPPGGEKSPYQTIRPCVRDTSVVDAYLEEGTRYFYLVVGRNSFPPYEGPASEEISIEGMPNLAFRADATPIALVTTPTGGGLKNLNAIMNGIAQESYDTYDDYQSLEEDWFGYRWQEPLYFDHIVYYEGRHFHDGGWWTALTVQFSDDAITWKNAPNVHITPPYDFADSRAGRKPYSRFDISFKPVRARRIRIYGSPGGVAGFTSIAELEVYGNQRRDPLMVYGVDRTVDERATALLDGSYSFSRRGPVTNYRWEQTGVSPAVTIQDANAPIAKFDAPGVDHDTLLTFTLTAGDETDEKTDEIFVLVRNLTTTAEAGSEITAIEGTRVELNGAASATTSGQLVHMWTQLSGPAVVLSDPYSREATFTAPFIWRFSEKLVFQLVVDDGLGRLDSISTDNVSVRVRSALNNMPHVEKSGLLVIEAENYTSLNRNKDDRGAWRACEGEPAYVEVPDISGVGGTRPWEQGAEITYDIKIRRPGGYYFKLRRFVPHGAGLDGEKNNSCRVGINGTELIQEFDNASNYNSWLWTPSRYLSFLDAGNYSLNIRCREDGYRIDRIVLYQPGAIAIPADWSSEVGPLESSPETEIVSCRAFGAAYYTPGTTHPVSLRIDVNTPSVPDTLSVSEFFPPSLSVPDPAGGDTTVPGRLTWTFTSSEISNRTLTYLLLIPKNTKGPLQFSGHLYYGDAQEKQIAGQSILYPLPPPPSGINVEILVDATVTWLPSGDSSVIAYHVYRSSDGHNWTDISGPCQQPPFVDSTIEPGVAYIYKVCSENPSGAQSPLSVSQTTVPQTAPYTELREAEDYDYGGGLSAGGLAAPPAVEASGKDDLSPGRDYFYQNETRTNSYRPNDPVDIRPGEGASGWFMGYSTTGDWWRYTFHVPLAGYVKLAYRGSTSSTATATIEFLWDEIPVGKITYNTPGGWRDWRYYSLEPFFSGAGPHVLRMRLASGNADYDLVAVGYNWPSAERKVIFSEDFSSYSRTSEVSSVGGWTIITGSSSPGAWQLWNTLGEPLSSEPGEPGPALPGMSGNYMVSNGDFAADIPLDEQLISPEIDCAGYDSLAVQFTSHINIFEDDLDGDLQTTDFDLSVYDPDSQSWSDWLTIFTHDRSAGDQSSATPLSFRISSLADGRKVKLRWHFYNTRYDFWWAIDNVVVSGRRATKPGIVAITVDPTGVLTFSWESFGTGYYTVQYTDDLLNPSWTDAEGTAWPTIATTWSGVFPPAQQKRFFRVISE